MAVDVKIVLAGVGGQGAVLAGGILASSAIKEGLSVRTYGDMGMARRGGSVGSFVNIFDAKGTSATAEGTADLLIGMEPIEAVRYCRYLKKDGTAIVNSYLILPSTVGKKDRKALSDVENTLNFIRKNFKNTIVFDANKVACEIDSLTTNVVMLGAAFSTRKIPVSTETFKHTIRDSFAPKIVKMNIKAFERGYDECNRRSRGGN
ncbi:MAG: indolepyruvate oxidoreductase subunit beta [Methanobacteriota archaeon]|nr:MAG: indolepyruvate oxidoreductase subunit beta [Euryarchaeota archaeon]